MGDGPGGIKIPTTVITPAFHNENSGGPFAAALSELDNPQKIDSFTDVTAEVWNYDTLASEKLNFANQLEKLERKLKITEDLVAQITKNVEQRFNDYIANQRRTLGEKPFKTQQEIRLNLSKNAAKKREFWEEGNKLISQKYSDVIPLVESVWLKMVRKPDFAPADLKADISYLLVDLKVKATGVTKDKILDLKAERKYLEEEIVRLGKKWKAVVDTIPYEYFGDDEIACNYHGLGLPDRATYKEWKKIEESIGAITVEYSDRIEEINAMLPGMEKRYEVLLAEIPRIIEHGVLNDRPVYVVNAGRYGNIIPASFAGPGGESGDENTNRKLQGELFLNHIYASLGENEKAKKKLDVGLELADNLMDRDRKTAIRISLLLHKDESSQRTGEFGEVNLEWIKEAEGLLEKLPVNSAYYEVRSHILLRKALFYRRVGGDEAIQKSKDILIKLKGRIRDILYTKVKDTSISGFKMPPWLQNIHYDVSKYFYFGNMLFLQNLTAGGIKIEHKVTASEAGYLYEAGILLANIEAKEAGFLHDEDETEEANARLADVLSLAAMLEMALGDYMDSGNAEKDEVDISVQAKFLEYTAQVRAHVVGHSLAICGYFKDSIDVLKDYVQKPLKNTVTADSLKDVNGFLAQMNAKLLDQHVGSIRDFYLQDDVAAAAKTTSKYLHSNFLGRRGALDVGGAGAGAGAGFCFCGPKCAAVGAVIGFFAGEGVDTVWQLSENSEFISQSHATGMSKVSTGSAIAGYAWFAAEIPLFYFSFTRVASPLGKGMVEAVKTPLREIGGAIKYGVKRAWSFWTSPVKNLKHLYGSLQYQAIALRTASLSSGMSRLSAGVRGLWSGSANIYKLFANRYSVSFAGAGGAKLSLDTTKVLHDMTAVLSYSWYFAGTINKVNNNWSDTKGSDSIFPAPIELLFGGMFLGNMFKIVRVMKPEMRAVAITHILSSLLTEGYNQLRNGQGIAGMDVHRMCTSTLARTFASYLGNVVTKGMPVEGWKKVAAATIVMTASTFPMTFIMQPLLDAHTTHYYANRLLRHPTTDIVRKAIRFYWGWNNPAAVLFDDIVFSFAENWFWTNQYPLYTGKALWKEEMDDKIAQRNYDKMTAFIKKNFSSGFVSLDEEPTMQPEDFVSFKNLMDSGYYGQEFFNEMILYLEYLRTQKRPFEQRLYHGLALTIAASNHIDKSERIVQYFEDHPYLFSTFGLSYEKSHSMLSEESLSDFITNISEGKYDHLFKMKNGVHKKRRYSHSPGISL